MLDRSYRLGFYSCCSSLQLFYFCLTDDAMCVLVHASTMLACMRVLHAREHGEIPVGSRMPAWESQEEEEKGQAGLVAGGVVHMWRNHYRLATAVLLFPSPASPAPANS